MPHRKSALPNGIRVVTETMPHVRSVAVGIWVETGSRMEPEPLGGISHLIEHLVFKGTATRSAEDIARAIDSVGGQMDAFTAKEHTCFYVSVLDEHLPLAVSLLTDILRHPLFAPADIEKVTYELARQIAENAPLSLAGMKQAITRMISLREQVPHEDIDALARQAHRSEDAKEGAAAMLEKRKPVFKGR